MVGMEARVERGKVVCIKEGVGRGEGVEKKEDVRE